MINLFIFPTLTFIVLTELYSSTCVIPVHKTQCIVTGCKTKDISSSYPYEKYNGAKSSISVLYNVSTLDAGAQYSDATARYSDVGARYSDNINRKYNTVELSDKIDMDIPCGFSKGDTLPCWYNRQTYKPSLVDNQVSYMLSGNKTMIHLFLCFLVAFYVGFVTDAYYLHKRIKLRDSLITGYFVPLPDLEKVSLNAKSPPFIPRARLDKHKRRADQSNPCYPNNEGEKQKINEDIKKAFDEAVGMEKRRDNCPNANKATPVNTDEQQDSKAREEARKWLGLPEEAERTTTQADKPPGYYSQGETTELKQE